MTIGTVMPETVTPESRKRSIVSSFTDNYAELIASDPSAWRGKFRKMADNPFAFFRGSAALFYTDVSRSNDPFLNDQTSRVWIQGDLHAGNFGTYMNGAGVLVFDVNDFDEAYVGPFTWDLKRLCASLALIGYQKAMSDAEIRQVIDEAARSYAAQVARFATGSDKSFALTLANAEGTSREILTRGRLLTRIGLLELDTEIVNGDRRFKINKNSTKLEDQTRRELEEAFHGYYQTIPKRKRRGSRTYQIKDIVRRRGMGIGSAGLKVFSVLLEGETQALENDIIISMKVALPSAAARYVNDQRVGGYFRHDGHRTAVSQRALQVYADPFLGYTELEGHGMFVCEVSPYTADLDWNDVNDLDEIRQLVGDLGRCVAKIHCCSDIDSDQTLVPFSTEHAIHGVLDKRVDEFAEYLTQFGESYAAQVRDDHRLFVDAFRNREILA